MNLIWNSDEYVSADKDFCDDKKISPNRCFISRTGGVRRAIIVVRQSSNGPDFFLSASGLYFVISRIGHSIDEAYVALVDRNDQLVAQDTAKNVLQKVVKVEPRPGTNGLPPFWTIDKTYNVIGRF